MATPSSLQMHAAFGEQRWASAPGMVQQLAAASVPEAYSTNSQKVV